MKRTPSCDRRNHEPVRRHTQRPHVIAHSVIRPTSPTTSVTPRLREYTSAAASLRDGALLPDRHAGLRPRGARISGLHQAAGTDRPGHHRSARREGAGHPVSARPGPGRLQHRHDDPLARLQRHLARRRMGSSLGQSGRHPGHGRLAVAQRVAQGKQPLTMRDVLTGDDQGARDPGLPRAGKLVQPRRARPRGAGEGGVHGRGRRSLLGLTRDEIINARVARLGGRPVACAPTATRRTPARARAGRRAMPPGAPCASR